MASEAKRTENVQGLTVPRYKTDRRFPSARTAGLTVLSDNSVLLIGVNEEQARGLIAQQLPGTKFDYTPATTKHLGSAKGSWYAFTGRELKTSEVSASTELGAVVVQGAGAAVAVLKATQIYGHLRTSNMALVLIDWE